MKPAEAVPGVMALAHAAYVRSPRSLWVGCGLVALLLLGSPHPVTGIAALVAVPWLVTLSWRSYEAPIMTFILGYHWLQATMILWLAIALRIPIDELARFQGARMLDATLLTLLGVVVLLLGVRAAWSSWRGMRPFAPEKIAGMHPRRRILRAWCRWLRTVDGEIASSAPISSLARPCISFSTKTARCWAERRRARCRKMRCTSRWPMAPAGSPTATAGGGWPLSVPAGVSGRAWRRR
jgi:hypothetical protein